MKKVIYLSNNVKDLRVEFKKEKNGRAYFVTCGISESLPKEKFYEAYTKEI